MKGRLTSSILIGFCLMLLLVILTATTINSQSSSDTVRPKLQLTTHVLGYRSCSAAELDLKLRLNIRNISRQPVILHKQTEIYRIMVSANASGADHKQYEQDLKYDDPGAQVGLNLPVFSDFTVVNPGEVIIIERTVSLYLFNPARPTERFLKSGPHLLQVAGAGGADAVAM